MTVNGTDNDSSQFDVVLGNDNSAWSGPLTITQGSVALPHANALTANNSVTLNPVASTVAGLYLFGQNITIGSLSGTTAGTMYIRNGSLTSGGYAGQPRSNATLTIDQTVSGAFNGIISDGPNDYKGGTSGTYYTLGLNIAGTANLASAGPTPTPAAPRSPADP